MRLMTVKLSGSIPDEVTFEQAIALTQSLLSQMEQGHIPESDILATIQKLVSTLAGARGFFVSYLTDDRPFADQPSEATLAALATSPEIVSELLVKNLAMSSAMVLTHRRRDDEIMAKQSERVRERSSQLIVSLGLPEFAEKLAQLFVAVQSGQGIYQSFLDRWNYDPEQREAIAKAIAKIQAQLQISVPPPYM